MIQHNRTKLLIGESGIKALQNSHIAVFGVGGVGSYVVEALARSGVGTLTLVDGDVVEASNINRQMIALHSTIGLPKVDVSGARCKDINPQIVLHTKHKKFLKEEASSWDFGAYDYVVDAIDMVTSKLSLIESARAVGTKIICATGAGNKMSNTQFEVADISKTTVCPLARVMRRELSKKGIKGVKVVYSKEEPTVPRGSDVVGSISYVPSTMGLIIAGEVIKEIIGGDNDRA
ncbi:MAG: tRNA threonylcarbamoyladenosine dehydratase [Bacillota bacterium]